MIEFVRGNLIYLCIPKNWTNTYYKLLYLLASVGKDIIDDCNYFCKDNGKNLFTCWNLFQSAIAAERIGENKKAKLFVNYVDKQLDIYYSNYKVVVPDFKKTYPNCAYEVTPEGNYKFYIDIEKDGQVYSSVITVPDVTEEFWYYGASNTKYAENININTLTKVSVNLLDNEFEIETTVAHPYLWIVSPKPLLFQQAGFTITLPVTEINGFYYYNSDALLPTVNTLYIKEDKI